MYGLCWANDHGYQVERLFKSWVGGAVLFAFLAWTAWQAAGPTVALLIVAGMGCVAIGLTMFLRRGRRWRCGAECGRKLPASMFAPGALNCKDCVAVRLLSSDIMRRRLEVAAATGGSKAAIALLDDSDAQWVSARQEAKRRLGLENAW
jgi:hypothetical protein